MDKRLAAYRTRTDKRRVAAAKRGRSSTLGLARGVCEQLRLLRGEEARKINDRLAQAGWRSRDAIVIYLVSRIGAPFAGIAWLAFLVSLLDKPTPTFWFAAVFFGIAAGGLGPSIYVQNIVTRRQQALRRALPDALDLLVICAEAGLGMDAALTRVSREIAKPFPELSDELSLTVIELRFLPDRRNALQNLARRSNLPDIRSVINTLIQTERYGTPLAHSLRVLAGEFRDHRMMRAEEKAARLPATLTVPMILFILPALFVVLIGPAMVQVVKNFVAH